MAAALLADVWTLRGLASKGSLSVAWVQLELQGQAPAARKGAAIAGVASVGFPWMSDQEPIAKFRRSCTPWLALVFCMTPMPRLVISRPDAPKQWTKSAVVYTFSFTRGADKHFLQCSCGQLPAGDGRADIRGGVVQV